MIGLLDEALDQIDRELNERMHKSQLWPVILPTEDQSPLTASGGLA